MPRVECRGVSGHNSLHEGPKSRWAGTDEEVEVVGHESPSEDLAGELLVEEGNAIQKVLVVVRLLKDCPAFHSTGHDVVQ